MDQSGQSSRRLSSLISRFQKDTRPPEEKKSNQNQGAKIDLRNQNATTSHTDKHPNTPDPLKRVGSSNGGYLPVIQSSYYPESSGLETRNNHVHDWVAKATCPASEVKIAVAKEIGPASVVIVAVAEETSPASDVETTVAKNTSPASEVKATVAKETSLASAVETAATKETSPASEAKQTVAKETSPVTEIETAVPKETNHSLEVKNPIQPFLSQVERDAETLVDDSRNLPETGTVDAAEEDAWDTEAGAENEEAPGEDGSVGFATGHSGDYDEIADFDVDELLEESSDEELPTLQEIYQRCQTIRKRRFYEDLYNVWQEKIRTDEKEDAMKILSACGFGKGDPDEMGDGLDTALSLVPDRFWSRDSSAKEISIEDLKMIVEEKKDAEERAQYRKYCQASETGGAKTVQARPRRAAIATAGGQSSAILHNYLKMNLLKSHVPMYYFPSYLQRFKAATEQVVSDAEDEDSDSD